MEPVVREAGVTRHEPKFPGTVLAAGIIWIIVGSLILLGAIAIAVVIPLLLAQRNNVTQPNLLLPGLVAAALPGLFGGVFALVGAQTVRGRAKDTLGNSIGSIIFGILFGGLTLNALGSGAGLGLLIAGILGLVGRSDYKVWRNAQEVNAVGLPPLA